MELVYIYHSGFALLGEKFTVIIDYYKDSAENSLTGIVHGELLKRPGRLYVLSSHSHADHFNPEIFQVSGPKEIHYILSQDTRRYMRDRLSLPNLHFMKAEESLALTEAGSGKSLSVKTFHSTDCGVAFLVETDGKKIYHAGDLNWWVWPGESKQYNHNMTANFQRYTEPLKGM